MSIEEKINLLIDHYGKEKQKDIAIEEMTELIKELIKERRYADNTPRILFEVADVVLMLYQLIKIYEFDGEEIQKIIEYKVDRQIARMENNDDLRRI